MRYHPRPGQYRPMDPNAYSDLAAARGDFKAAVESWSRRLPALGGLQDRLREELGYRDYEIETPIVYNRALDDLGPPSSPRWIVIADNPGKNEQKAANNRYLVGQAGKLAAEFFERRLGRDFRRDAVIINKTPIHSPKTAELSKLLRMDSSGGLRAVFDESQKFMAGLALRFHRALGLPVWISGKSGLSPKGIFSTWFGEFRRLFSEAGAMEEVFVFSHFSMNRFSIELGEKADPGKPLEEELLRIGRENRLAVFGA